MSETMAEMFQVCTGSGEVCGAVSPELRKALEGSPVRIFAPFMKM